MSTPSKNDQPTSNPFAAFGSMASGPLLFGSSNSTSTPAFSFNASSFGSVSNKKDESNDKKGSDDEDEDGEDGDDADAAADESHAADFKPVVELARVEVKSYEEDEDVTFKSRAKLFKFVKEDTYGDEVRKNYWKERGLGDIKVLKNRATNECRLLMRQEKTLKICLNHKISPQTELKPQPGTDGKAWTFAAIDFADDEPKQDTFALKVGTPEVANEFKKAFDEARKLNGNAKKTDPAPGSPARTPPSPAKTSPVRAAASPSKVAASGLESVTKDLSKLNANSSSVPVAGGYIKCNAEDPEVKNIVRFASDKIGQGALVKVASVKKQVVAGLNYRMALHIKHSDGQVFAHVVTVFQPLPHTKEPLTMSQHDITGKVV